MKIYLKNFRVYEDKTFEFDEKGFFLISAPSGYGKSTILLGINYALYGVGKNIVKRQKPGCEVHFYFEDMKIIRTSKPKRLIVNDIYEDDVAQNVINEKFGDCFNVTGYIAQNALNSFIIMSPIEKLQFLEMFAFKDINLIKIKNDLKILEKQKYDCYNKVKSELNIITNILETSLVEPKKVSFPFKKSQEGQIDEIYNNATSRIDKYLETLKNLETVIQKNILKKNDLKILETNLSNKDDNIDNLIDQLNNLSIDNEDNENLEQNYNDLLNYRKKLKIQREKKKLEEQLLSQKNQMNEMKKKEDDEINQEKIKIKNELWVEYDKDDVEENIKDLKNSLNDMKQLNFLKKKLKNLEDDIENKITITELNEQIHSVEEEIEKIKRKLDIIEKLKESYTCPSCHTLLNLNENNQLILLKNDIVDNKLQKENESELKKQLLNLNQEKKNLLIEISEKTQKQKQISSLTNQIKEIEDSYEEILSEAEIQEALNDMNKYFLTQIGLEEKLKKLNSKKNNYSSSLKYFDDQIQELEERLEEYLNEETELSECENFDEFYKNEDDLNKKISEYERILEKYKHQKENKKKLLLEKKRQEDQRKSFMRDFIEKYDDIEDIDVVEKRIQEKQEEKTEFETKLNKMKKTKEDIENYKNYLLEKKKYDDILEKKNNLEKQEKIENDEYLSVLKFKEKILETESIALINIINTINVHAQFFLEKFFPENSLIVTLTTFKEVKKNSKPQINLDVIYDGEEADIASLSGGELARVILAFTLSLNEIFQTPLLLLDESTSSLEQETTTIVFDTIKEHFENKIVLCVAHQVTEGVFDEVVRLNNN
jgi:DNA repair exonuclease SbcCD ATPase subunit